MQAAVKIVIVNDRFYRIDVSRGEVKGTYLAKCETLKSSGHLDVKLTQYRETSTSVINIATDFFVILCRRYLEELSKNYKRQMEDMYTSLNKTITKLTNTSKSAEARVCFISCLSLSESGALDNL